MKEEALLIYSGGQDSGTCLAWALEHFSRVTTLGFVYGQRHHVEMQCRLTLRDEVACAFPHWGQRLGPDVVLEVDFFRQLEATALTAALPIAGKEGGVPNTFVPGRNMLFLTLAATWAYGKDLRHIVTGVCETDSSGYPDCRDDAMKALQVALNIGMDSRYVMHTPLMWRTKAQTWAMAEELGGQNLVDILLEHSHTCYLGTRDTRYAWGYGCGQCPACVLRERGYEEYMKGKRHD